MLVYQLTSLRIEGKKGGNEEEKTDDEVG